jgi:pimeloyl-ACP methyl ester carboxylesterase
MTEYLVPITLGASGNGDSGILANETYHIVFGETSGYGMYVDFKTDANNKVFYQLYDDTEGAATTTPDVLEPVIIIPGILGSEQHNGMWEMDPILHTYDDLIATLDANAYTLGVDLFTFPYNWRKSNIETAVLLKQKIDEVKGICGCEKVDLVAHSMGGLVARQYIQSDAYEQDVDQLIFLGTPHLGAPKAYLMWEGGELSPAGDFLDELTEFVLKHESSERGFDSLFEYINSESIQSVKQLLPIYDYIFDGNVLRNYGNGYPRNTFLENLESNIDTLYSSGVQIDNLIGESDAKSTIVGIQAFTTNDYLPKWRHGYPEDFYAVFGDHGLIKGMGDETVPTASASRINTNLVSTSSSHSALPSVGAEYVYRKLTQEDASILIRKDRTINKRLLLIKVLSPVDIIVIAPDGKKIGKGLDGFELNEIPRAFYSGFTTDMEYVSIPDPLDGTYRIVTQGNGEGGSFTIETAYLNDTLKSDARFTGNTTPGLITELNVSVNNSAPEEMEIVPEDMLPPEIVIVNPLAEDYERSAQLSVEVSASDESGVRTLVTIMGTTTVPNIGTIDLFFQKLGDHTLTASSTDNLGNATSTTIEFRVIATPDSVLSDIERAYSLGWITKSVKNSLTKKLQAAIKVNKVLDRRADRKPHAAKAQRVVDKFIAAAMLIEIQKRRGKGLNEQAFELFREDLRWLINN